jgi:hypothetical protein
MILQIAICIVGGIFVSAVAIAIAVGEAAMNSTNYDTDTKNTPAKWVLGSMEEGLTDFEPYISSKDFSQYFILDPYIEFYVKSKRGRISLWWFHESNREKTVIMFPGSKLHNRSASSLLVAGMFWKQGYNVAMTEYLDHGSATKDDGRRNFGAYEKYDCVAVYDYIQKELGVSPTHAFGQSMGGTIALLLSQYRKIECVIADSAPLHMDSMITDIYAYARLSALLPVCGPLTTMYMKLYDCYLPKIYPNPYCKCIVIFNRQDKLVRKASHVKPFMELNSGNINIRNYPGGHMHGPFLCTGQYEQMIEGSKMIH